MLVAFELTMPHRGSWNNKWSGDHRRYVQIRTLPKSKADKIIGKSYRYNWDDGWSAIIEVTQVNSKEKQKLLKISQGFSSYYWMIDSIIWNGEILNS